ncbi:MAG: hypothetical protein AAFO63_01165 [Pseudomonadota bacterium]
MSERDPQLVARDRRNKWLAGALVLFVVLVAATTASRLKSADLGKDGGFYFTGQAPDFGQEGAGQ